MTTDYNQGNFAEKYKQAKAQPWRQRIETYSFLQRIGDLRGKRVVDLACGEGHYTRLLRKAGAAEVVGVDISERMIDLARAQEQADPLGIDYRVGDARELFPQQDFDLVVSAWFLVYAHDRGELSAMLRGIARWLRPGGRFVTVTTNPEVNSYRPAPDYRKYGFRMTLADDVYEGAPILWTNELDASELVIENYYLPRSAIAEAFAQNGFRDFQIHLPSLEPHPDSLDDRAFWDDFLRYPVMVVLEATRE